jgi:hypothetical protein
MTEAYYCWAYMKLYIQAGPQAGLGALKPAGLLIKARPAWAFQITGLKAHERSRPAGPVGKIDRACTSTRPVSDIVLEFIARFLVVALELMPMLWSEVEALYLDSSWLYPPGRTWRYYIGSLAGLDPLTGSWNLYILRWIHIKRWSWPN